MKGPINSVVSFLAGLLLLCTVLSYLPIDSFVFELFSHFRAHYFIAAILGLLLAVLLRGKWLIGIALGLAFLNGMEVLPWYSSQGKETTESSLNIRLRLMQSNVLWLNTAYGSLIGEVKKKHPDLIVLQEFTPAWNDNVSELKELYPYHLLEPRDGGFGMALFSKFPLQGSEVFENTDLGIVSLKTSFLLEGKTVSVFAIHPPPPMNGLMYSLRDKEFEFVVEKLSEMNGPKILVGDLNSTMWSPSYKRLLNGSSLQNARDGFGLTSTWPSYLPIGGIPIDHCFVSKEFQVADFRVGSNVGSDHFPIIIDLRL